MTESDGVEESLEQIMRIAMSSAARVGEALARLRQQQHAHAAAASQRRAVGLEGRFEAERDLARAAYSPVHESSWWETAQSDDIAHAYQYASAWRDVDPEAERAQQHIATEVHERYGVDVTTSGSTLGPRLEEAVADQATSDPRDLGETAGMLAAADRADHQFGADAPSEAQVAFVAEQVEGQGFKPAQAEALWSHAMSDEDRSAFAEKAGLAWDSPERRDDVAAHLHETVADPQAVNAKMVADTANAKPVGEATRRENSKGRRSGPKGRRSPLRSRQTQQQR